MESLGETKWDVLISGTGLQNSLLALALSRSDKKVLHVDQNEYYGDSEAAFSLQEVDEWVEKKSASDGSFRNASLWKAEEGLSFSRAYTLTLSPQIIYTKSKLLLQLVSSKVYRQLEFQAVGNWWIYDEETLRRLPNGREDIFQDKAIDNRSKRGLMKFLKFVIDFENQADVWEAHADEGLGGFLSSKFQLPTSLQSVITALTLSLQSPENTPVKWALPRIARHLTSIGVFGPGFGAVIPKWGGGAEMAQVACRSGAVGGGIYILGTGVQKDEASGEDSSVSVTLTNGEVVTTQRLIGRDEKQDAKSSAVSKIIAVVSSPLTSLFKSTVEGAPLSAVSVVALPPGSITISDTTQTHPIYIMAHSNETGECPAGQSLVLDNGAVITEITAICEYLDEVATSGTSLFGKNSQERAETRMWLRRMDMEIAQPVIAWFRNDPATIDFYKGNRIPIPEAQVVEKVVINRFLNLLDDELEGKTWLAGDRFSAADIHFYGLVKMMIMGPCPWVNSPGRKNVAAYFQRLDERPAFK